MRTKLFWRLGLTYLALLLAVLIVVDFYAARILRAEYLRAAENQLGSLEKLAEARLPRIDDGAAARAWAEEISTNGAQVSLFDSSGSLIVDSSADLPSEQNVADSPEILQALSSGKGESVRRSETPHLDMVSRATRYQLPSGQTVVIRMALPLTEMKEALGVVRRRLWTASLLMLILGGAASLVFSRRFSSRVERLKDFSRRVATGDFRPLSRDDSGDELAELARALNATASHFDATIRSLTDERNRSSAILRSMVEGVAVMDAKERVIFCNSAFAEILNLDPARCEGRPLLELVRQAGLLSLAHRALEGGGNIGNLQGEIVLGTASPRCFAVTASAIAVPERTKNALVAAPVATIPHGAVLVLHEITELRRLERVRQDFVANVSHEFRTPLTAIQGFAETLLGGALEDEKNNRRFLEIIRDHAVRLSRLTDDLLKLARIEAGKLEVQFQSVSLPELIESCAATTLLKASQRNIALEISYPPEFPAVLGDASLLREVLQNLLDNAVQYTPPSGRVDLRAAQQDGKAVITVADTGIGIPLVDQERIFERFYRVDASRYRDVQSESPSGSPHDRFESGYGATGTGLGLSIAKHIVEAHGGRLWVESSVGQGSRFQFSIPLVE